MTYQKCTPARHYELKSIQFQKTFKEFVFKEMNPAIESHHRTTVSVIALSRILLGGSLHGK